VSIGDLPPLGGSTVCVRNAPAGVGPEPAVLYRRVALWRADEREVSAMAAGAVDVSVAATPDEVWKKVGDFAGVADFFPGIDSFRIEGDDRIIGMFGMEIRERLLAKDEENRVITYSVVEGVPIDSHTATISVESEGDGCKVIWAYDVTPDEMAPIFGDTYKAALTSLEGTFS
jgi:carbon monoxide dehydrogenase subunit G